MNDTWGSRKKNFYGRDKKTGDDVTSSSDDEDERLEALRLQKVRAKKLQALAQQSEAVEEAQQEQSRNKATNEKVFKEDSSEESDEDFMSKRARKTKLGDRLFAEDVPKNASANLSNEKNKTNEGVSSI